MYGRDSWGVKFVPRLTPWREQGASEYDKAFAKGLGGGVRRLNAHRGMEWASSLLSESHGWDPPPGMRIAPTGQ
jgi:hypothetical protein